MVAVVLTTGVCSARRRPQCLVPINDCYYLKPHTSTFTTPNSGDEPSGRFVSEALHAHAPWAAEEGDDLVAEELLGDISNPGPKPKP